MISIELSTPKLGTHKVLIDDEDFTRLDGYGWTLWTSKRHYGIYVIGYKHKGDNKSIRLHRLIMNAQTGDIVDHINGNPLDNRKENLRITTSLINNQNARKRKDGITSKFKGVHWCKIAKRWKAQIQFKGKKLSLGSYLDEEKASNAYINFCKENHIVILKNII